MRTKQEMERQLERCLIQYHRVETDLKMGKFLEDTHTAVRFWLSGVSGLISALRWTLGKDTFAKSFEPFDPNYVNRMLGAKMPFWQEEWALPGGQLLHFENEIVAPKRVRPESDVHLIFKRCAEVHGKIHFLNKIHPGKWHPMYQGRVIRWLVFGENVVRAFDWIIGNASEASTFYMINPDSMREVGKAQLEVRPYSMQAMAALKKTIDGFDHKPEDFE